MEEIHISLPLVWKEVKADKAGLDIVEITGKAFMFKFEDGEEYIRILEAMCLENAISVGGHVGEVLIAEDPHYIGRYFRKFLRVRVMLNLRKPLAHGFWLPKPDGRNVWISMRYEKLQNFFYTCGKIGHDNRDCNFEKLMSGSNPNEPRFGAWLATNEGENDSSEEVEDLFSIKPSNPEPKTRREDLGKAWKSGDLRSEGFINPDLNEVMEAWCMKNGMNKSKAPSIDTEGPSNSGRSNKDVLESRNNLKADGTNSPVVATSIVKAGSSPKIKARIRISARKKDRGGKENIPEEEGKLDDVMEEPKNPNTVGSTFTFKASSSKRKKMVANSYGCWPLSATKSS
ncbi:hypothetical protein K1719_017533 [Acacia pycnantha]|nr:hypothetical protein K1719_017533 [Acacia pycnantha]